VCELWMGFVKLLLIFGFAVISNSSPIFIVLWFLVIVNDVVGWECVAIRFFDMFSVHCSRM